MDNQTHKITEEFPFKTREIVIYLLQRWKIEFLEEHWIDEGFDREDDHDNIDNPNFDMTTEDGATVVPVNKVRISSYYWRDERVG
jgi:hypothetical protein